MIFLMLTLNCHVVTECNQSLWINHHGSNLNASINQSHSKAYTTYISPAGEHTFEISTHCIYFFNIWLTDKHFICTYSYMYYEFKC